MTEQKSLESGQLKKIKSKKIVVFFNKSDLEGSQIKFREWKEKIPEINKFKSISKY